MGKLGWYVIGRRFYIMGDSAQGSVRAQWVVVWPHDVRKVSFTIVLSVFIPVLASCSKGEGSPSDQSSQGGSLVSDEVSKIVEVTTISPISLVSASIRIRSIAITVLCGFRIPFLRNHAARLRSMRALSLGFVHERTEHPGVQQLKHRLCSALCADLIGSGDGVELGMEVL